MSARRTRADTADQHAAISCSAQPASKRPRKRECVLHYDRHHLRGTAGTRLSTDSRRKCATRAEYCSVGTTCREDEILLSPRSSSLGTRAFEIITKERKIPVYLSLVASLAAFTSAVARSSGSRNTGGSRMSSLVLAEHSVRIL